MDYIPSKTHFLLQLFCMQWIAYDKKRGFTCLKLGKKFLTSDTIFLTSDKC